MTRSLGPLGSYDTFLGALTRSLGPLGSYDTFLGASGQRIVQDLVSRHDAAMSPNFEDGYPTKVGVQIFILSFNSISEVSMDYSLCIFLRQTWNDSRLVYPPLEGVRALELDTRVMDSIWVPDLYFTNEKTAHFHDVTVPNKLMNIYPDGQVLYSMRISMKLTCDMNLWKYPFDSQVCNINMESYSYSTENVVFYWLTDPVQRRRNMFLPQFQLTKYETMDCTKVYIGANYTCIRVEFTLVRNYGYFMSQVYIPSLLVVILSWVSFWLDIDAVPARISLGLLTVLTMTTQSVSARSDLPRVSYIKALDVWMAMCLIFVFSALIEFAYVNVLARVERRRQTKRTWLQVGPGVEGEAGSGGPESEQEGENDGGEKDRGKKRLFPKLTVSRHTAHTLDIVSRVLFPSVFLVFNIFYWIFYMAI
ncbi:glycine receptor subunit alpha-2-like [Babylonia areolata]|uniref:glycine receptor subunit alpha-2-like n=1 Tax=Babylonia areolata TaxID=304850 RepID=UPI003FD57C55